jgi:polar amino acid transport system substrate-binding protein
MSRYARRPLRRTFPAEAGAVLLVTFVLGNCGVVPRDSAGSLDRVRGGELRVGVVDHPPWVRVDDDQITGVERDLLERWAQQLNTTVVWRPGAEADLVEALRRRDIDVLAAGLVSDSPYRSQIAFTQPYLEYADAYGSTKAHVLAVMPGESALLLSLDRFLASEDKTALRRRAGQHRPTEARRP